MHTLKQIDLLLHQDMPYSYIKQSLKLRFETLDELVRVCYFKIAEVHRRLSTHFKQHELLGFYIHQHYFKNDIIRMITKKTFYPCAMFIMSYCCFLVFYFAIFPLFKTLIKDMNNGLLNTYVLLNQVFLVILLLIIVFLFIIVKSPYKQTLILRKMHRTNPNSIIFDYYNDAWIMLYAMSLKANHSSLMTIELLRNLHHYPYLQASAYDVYIRCQSGQSLHQAMCDAQLSNMLTQSIQLGIAANDLPLYIERLSVLHHDLFLLKLERLMNKFNLMFYGGIVIHLLMIINILQMPLRMIQTML